THDLAMSLRLPSRVGIWEFTRMCTPIIPYHLIWCAEKQKMFLLPVSDALPNLHHSVSDSLKMAIRCSLMTQALIVFLSLIKAGNEGNTTAPICIPERQA